MNFLSTRRSHDTNKAALHSTHGKRKTETEKRWITEKSALLQANK